MNRTLSAALRMVPMVATMGTIFFLSHQPGGDFFVLPLPGLDKLAHVAVYAILAFTTLFSFSGSFKKKFPRTAILLTITCSLAYGISDEFHQSFIPGRFVSIGDVVADCTGAVISCGIWLWWKKSGRAMGA